MLCIAYRQPTSREVPPLFMMIDDKLLVATVQELIQVVYQAFKGYLSPFVSQEQMQLLTNSGEGLHRKMPIFLYFQYGDYTQNIFCQIRPKEEINKYNRKYDDLFLNLVVKYSLRNNKEKHEDIIIKPKGSAGDAFSFIDALIKLNDKIYIGGKQITLLRQSKWSQLIKDKWDALENIRDRCIYLCIDRP